MAFALADGSAGGGVKEGYFGFETVGGDCVDWLVSCEVCDCVAGDQHDWWMLLVHWRWRA